MPVATGASSCMKFGYCDVSSRSIAAQVSLQSLIPVIDRENPVHKTDEYTVQMTAPDACGPGGARSSGEQGCRAKRRTFREREAEFPVNCATASAAQKPWGAGTSRRGWL